MEKEKQIRDLVESWRAAAVSSENPQLITRLADEVEEILNKPESSLRPTCEMSPIYNECGATNEVIPLIPYRTHPYDGEDCCQNCKGCGRVRSGPIPSRAQGYLESICYVCHGTGKSSC
jgi:hypothetical protein